MIKGRLIVISGPSGVGKGTVRRKLFEDQNLNLAYSISNTTRKPRVGESDGVDYNFISIGEFEDKIAKGQFLEYARFVDNYYGTSIEFVEQLLAEGKNVVLEIEVEGARQVIAKRPDAITIFILPPSLDALAKRITARSSETKDVIKKRLDKAIAEIECKNQYQYIVINDNVDQAASEIIEIIKKNL